MATVEHKTLKGKVEYLVPALTINALEVMREYARPLQAKLDEEIKLLETGSTTLSEKERVIRLAKAKSDSKKLFLCLVHGPIAGSMPYRAAHHGLLSADLRRPPASTGICNPISAGEPMRVWSWNRRWEERRLSS